MPTAPPLFRPAGRTSHQKPTDPDRGSARARGYDARWERSAKADRARQPFCVGCDAVGRVELATLTDHVIPHRGDSRLFLDPANWQSCCDWHHNVIKKRLEAAFDAGKVAASALRLNSPEAIALTRAMASG